MCGIITYNCIFCEFKQKLFHRFIKNNLRAHRKLFTNIVFFFNISDECNSKTIFSLDRNIIINIGKGYIAEIILSTELKYLVNFFLV